MKPEDVFRNEFLTGLKGDYVAIDSHGTPYARASDLDAVKRAAPGAAAYYTGRDFEPATEPVKVVPSAGLVDTPVFDETPKDPEGKPIVKTTAPVTPAPSPILSSQVNLLPPVQATLDQHQGLPPTTPEVPETETIPDNPDKTKPAVN